MQKVLLIATDLELGGTPTVVAELCRRLPGVGIRAEAASLKGEGEIGRRLKADGHAVHAFNAASVIQLPAAAGWLASLVHRGRFDAVISFLMHANAVAAVASQLSSGVRSIQAIQTAQPHPAWHWPIQALAATRADAVIVPSPSVAAFVDRHGIHGAKVISNAVDATAMAEQVASRRRPHDGWRVGFIGRLDPIKRVGDLVQAMPLIAGTLHIYGDGPEAATIGSMAAASAARGRITMHGKVASPAEALAELDCLVLPSYAEGFGLVLIEAMAAGVPVVATNVPGCRDVVQDNRNGLLVPPQSPPSLARAIGRLQQDALLRSSLIEQARHDVQARYAWPNVLQRYAALIRGDALR